MPTPNEQNFNDYKKTEKKALEILAEMKATSPKKGDIELALLVAIFELHKGELPAETIGASLGVQLLGHNEDYFLVPEIAFEAPQGDATLGFGLDFQIKTGRRSYLNARGIITSSDNPNLERSGVFVSETVVF